MKKFLTIFVMLAVFAGCAQLTQLVNDKPLLIKTSVQIATVEYLKYNPHRLEPMSLNVETVKTLVDTGELGTVDLIATKIKELISKDKTMLPEELLLAYNVVDIFAAEAKEILLAQGYLDDKITIENKDTALQVLTWITDAVNLMRNKV